jgi:ABC-type branched-subunit amino acid transport system ATPase component/branched-subunit amino acid ABC-type transport system permease component
MNQLLTFVVLGTGPGAIYGLIGIAIVAIHRGSSVINFAAGAMAMCSAYIYFTLEHNHGFPIWLAAVVSVVAGAVLGLVVYQLALRPLEKESSLVQMIATLGVMIVLQQTASLIYGTDTQPVRSVLPTSSLELGGVKVGADRVLMLVIAIVLTAALTTYYKQTRTGLASTALAESRLSVLTQGFSTVRLNTVTWTIGGSLAGVAGILIAPISGLSVTSLTLLVVDALAAALIGSMTSPWQTLGGAVIIGVAESLTTGYISFPGAAEAIPLIAITAVLILRGRHLPARGYVGLRLPAVGTGRIRVVPLVVVSVLLLVSVSTWITSAWTVAIMVSGITAILCLSVVVITGFTGQISLAQYAIGGLGGLIAAWTGVHWHLPFILALLAGGLGVIPVGVILAAISFRVRGRNLAVLTMAAAVIINVLIFSQIDPMLLPSPSLFVSIDSIAHPRRYAVVVLVALILLSVGVARLRSSELGRRMLAVRANEVAAASLGINVSATKTWAFVISSFIAGIGGGLIIYENPFADFSSYDIFGSINLVVWSVIGGVGYVIGPLFSGFFVTGGLGTSIGQLFGATVQNYLPLAGGALLILLLIQSPDGGARQNVELLRRVGDWLAPRLPVRFRAAQRPHPDPAPAAAPEEQVVWAAGVSDDAPVVLSVADVSIAFGGVKALTTVGVDVRAGEVVGLIGSNGAGKTTLIDVVTGMTRADTGSVSVGGEPVDTLRMYQRARSGLGRSFQSLELFDELTLTDNLVVAAHPKTTGDNGIPLPARQAVVSLGLSDLMDSTPQNLSYGQRRLLAVVRSLATNPRVLLLDEPASGLDEVDVLQLAELLRRVARETSVGVLLVEHNVGMVMRVCDRIYVLDGGRVVATGTPAEVQANPDVVRAYLGPGTVRDDEPVSLPGAAS